MTGNATTLDFLVAVGRLVEAADAVKRCRDVLLEDAKREVVAEPKRPEPASRERGAR